MTHHVTVARILIVVLAWCAVLGCAGVGLAQDKPKVPSPYPPKPAPPVKMPPEGIVVLPLPASPVALPTDEVITAGLNENAEVVFSWKPGNRKIAPYQAAAAPEYFHVCVYEGNDCRSSSNKQDFNTIDKSLTSYTPPNGLDHDRFQGRQFHWAIRACTSKYCSNYSEPRPMRWLLPAPGWNGGFRGSKVLPEEPDRNPYLLYGFRWIPVVGAEYYYFCIYTGHSTRCVQEDTMRSNDPFVRRREDTFYNLDFDISQFRGREDARWTASACTSRLPSGEQCTINQEGWSAGIHNILTPPVLDPGFIIGDDQPSVTFRWSLTGVHDIDHILICVMDDYPGPDHGYYCERYNRMDDPIRPANTTSCTMHRPLYGGPDPDDQPAFSFAVGACNQRDRCWWSTLARVNMNFDDDYTLGPVCD